MKITILALHLGYGGIEKFISNIANMFSKENDIEIISVYKLYDKPVFEINPNVKIKYLIEDLKPNREEFINSIKHFRIIQTIKEGMISAKILYLKKARMKKAITKLNCDIAISTIPSHNKLLGKYGRNVKKKIATEHNYKAIDRKYINKIANSCKNIDLLVIASKKLSQIYAKYMKDKVKNIPLSLDFIPSKKSNLEGKEITYIGRLSEEKGVLDLIEVFNYVHQNDCNVKLNIVGDGNKKEQMIEKVKEYGLEENVVFHGFKNKTEINEILLQTSIGINTSYTESFGLAVLETFSYGIPCVVFSTAEGVVEIMENEKEGYIIENRNIKEMAHKIVYLVNNQDKRKELGANAINKSVKYSLDEIRKKWEEII